MGRWGLVLRWVVASGVGLAFSWAVGAVFLESVFVYQWDEQIRRWVPPKGYSARWTREGWATTHYDAHATLWDGSHDADAPRVVFWGDSYVEALQIPHGLKMHEQFRRFWQQAQEGPVVSVAAALSGRDPSDVYFLLPRMESVFQPIMCHVVVIHLSELRAPRGWTPGTPPFRESIEEPLLQKFRFIPHRYRMTAWWDVFREASRTTLRFGPGEVTLPKARNGVPAGAHSPQMAYWRSALEALRGQTDRPMLIVRISAYPRIKDGRIEVADPRAQSSAMLGELCRETGMGYVDLHPYFAEYLKTTGQLPRGFAQTIPGEGHLNTAGHRLVARAVFDALRRMEQIPSHQSAEEASPTNDSAHGEGG